MVRTLRVRFLRSCEPLLLLHFTPRHFHLPTMSSRQSRSEAETAEGKAEKLAGGEARLGEREPPDQGHYMSEIKAACRTYARNVWPPSAHAEFAHGSHIPPACGPHPPPPSHIETSSAGRPTSRGANAAHHLRWRLSLTDLISIIQ